MPNWKKVIISGSDAALNSLEITSHLTASGLIYPTSDGTNGQAITTDAAGNLTFGNPGFADEAEKVTFEVKNGDTGTLAKGTPVHITSMTGGTAIVVAASASVASKMPSHGILNQQLTAGSDGFATILGQVTGVNTSAFSPGDTVYVGPSGGYTNVKPSGSTNLIQNLGVVKKVDASNGTGEIFGSGRTNDVPNLPTGKIWVGNDYTVTSSVIHLDEPNSRLGINTNTPNQALDVLGSANISGSLVISNPSFTGTHTISQIANNQFRFTNSGIGAYMTVGGGNTVEINGQQLKALGRGAYFDNTVSGNSLQVGTAGVGAGKGLTVLNSANSYNVGIGSNTPTAKLNIVGNGTTSATTALLIEDSSGTDLLEVNDQGNVTIPNGSLSLNGATNIETFNLLGNMFFDGSGTISAGGVGDSLILQAQSANIAIGYPNAADITITGGVSGSFSGSFAGDGTNLTGITAEWDGTHDGDAEITGSLTISGSSADLTVTGNVGIGTTSPASNAKLTVMGNQTFGIPGNGSNTSGRFISIEGNTDGGGEGSSRIFFTEHNSTTASMDKYGMSIGYRGGDTSITGASGNVWTGLSQIGNGEWGMWGHNDSATGVRILRGDRAGTYTAIYSGDVERFRVHSNGNVGIGTTSPSSKLQVVGNVSASGFTSDNIYGATYPSNSFIRFDDDQTASSNNVSIGSIGRINYLGDTNGNHPSADPAHQFFTGTTDIDTATALMTITAGGNVGIGTTSPIAKLDIVGTESNFVARFSNHTTTGYAPGSIILESGQAASRGQGIYHYNIQADESWFTGVPYNVDSKKWIVANKLDTTFNPDVAQLSYALMTIDSDTGNVGIGTTSPAYALDIERATGEVAIQLQARDNTSNTAIYFGDNNDSDVGSLIYNQGSNYMSFTTNTGERMRITSAGNVGIGTTNPSHLLHIESTSTNARALIKTTGTGNFTAAAQIVCNDSDLFFGAADDGYTAVPEYTGKAFLQANGGDFAIVNMTDDLEFYAGGRTSADKHMVVTGAGNVGIGTTTPTQPLHVAGNTRIEGSVYDSTNSAGTSGQVLSSTVTGTQWIAAGSGTIGGSGTTNYVSKFTGGTTLGNSLIYDNGTNVGIGTTSPGSKLQVNVGTDQNLAINSSGGVARISSYNDAITASTPLKINGSELRFEISNAEKMRITSAGNVGIGTTNPVDLLHINSNTHDARMILDSAAGFDGELKFFENGSAKYTIGYDAGTSNFVIGTINVDTGQRLAITSAGNVGIGTTSPTSKLDVEGDIAIKNANISNQELIVPPGTTPVVIASSTIYSSIAIDYVVKNGLNLRSGTIVACHDGTSTVFTETSTPDLGTTADITFTVNLSGGNLTLDATTTLPSWEIKTLVRAL